MAQELGPLVSAGTRRPRILIVDDSRAHRLLLRRALTNWGFDTVEAGSGDEALDLVASEDLSFVISDWMMPGMSGVEFCARFRAARGARPGYFILLTAQTDRDHLARGLEAGADDFLSKPFNSVELRARVSAGLRVLSAQSDLVARNGELSAALDELRLLYDALDRDLAEARKFQHGLVPRGGSPVSGAEVSVLYRPSGHVGGDLVGVFPVSETRLGVYAIDVSGHGVASALVTARVAGHLSGSDPERNIAIVTKGGRSAMRPPDEVCARLNEMILSDAESGLYLTMVLADLCLDSGRVLMCQAGHPSPAVLREDGRIEFAEAFGMPVGLIEDADYRTTELTLYRGECLLLYSDGVTECPGPDGTLLDEEGLRRLLGRHPPGDGLVLGSLLGDLEAYSGTPLFPDDISAIMVRRLAGQARPRSRNIRPPAGPIASAAISNGIQTGT